MTQNDLNRLVSRATGETVTEITRRGFSLASFEEQILQPPKR